MTLQPEVDVRLPAHRADLDRLLHAKEPCRHAGVDAVRQLRIVLAIGLDDRRGVDAGSSAKSIVSHHRVILGDRNPRGPRHYLAVVLQLGEVLARPGLDSEQFQVDQHLVHLRVADALADAASRSVHNLRACDQRTEGVGNRESAIAVAVPLHANIGATGLHHFVHHELDQRDHTHRSGMSHSVANDDGLGSAIDGRGVHALDGFRIAACGVFGDVHHVEPVRHRELHRMLSRSQQEVVGPVFGVAADGAGPDEGRRFDGNSGALHNLGDGPDIVLMGARRTVGLDVEARAADLSGQCLGVRHGARPGARQPDVEHVDADLFHQVEDLDFLFDGRVAHRGRL